MRFVKTISDIQDAINDVEEKSGTIEVISDSGAIVEVTYSVEIKEDYCKQTNGYSREIFVRHLEASHTMVSGNPSVHVNREINNQLRELENKYL